jgi:hypothetical protein
MKTLEQYFNQVDTPEAGSPIGAAISVLVKRVPQITPEEAREIVSQSLYVGAKKYAESYAAKRVQS